MAAWKWKPNPPAHILCLSSTYTRTAMASCVKGPPPRFQVPVIDDIF